jgi:hypothetical protein
MKMLDFHHMRMKLALQARKYYQMQRLGENTSNLKSFFATTKPSQKVSSKSSVTKWDVNELLTRPRR